MKESHPKRRKDKYNPYTLTVIDGRFYLSFKDGQGQAHCMEIDRAMYTLFGAFELEDLSYLNEWDRHIERSELSEATLEQRMLAPPASVEDTFCQKICHEQLRRAIALLPKVQRRRLILYFFYDFTYEQIAEIESCSVHSVFVAIERAKEKIKFFLKQG